MKIHVVILDSGRPRATERAIDADTLESIRAQRGVDVVAIDQPTPGSASKDLERLAAVLAATEAEYVALIHDGDRWTSSDKLRQQLDWLVEHDFASSCFHAANVEETDDEARSERANCVEPPGCADFYAADDVWSERSFVPLSTLVFRRDSLLRLPDWSGRPLANPSFVLPVLLAEQGVVGYVDEPWAQIDRGSSDANRSRGGVARFEAEMLERRFVNARLDFRYETRLERYVARRGVELARECLDSCRIGAARRYLWRAFSQLPLSTALRAGALPLRLLFPPRRRVS